MNIEKKTDLTLNTAHYEDRLNQVLLYRESGRISKSVGLLFEAHLPGAAVGSLCEVIPSGNPNGLNAAQGGIQAEVIGFRDKKVFLMPYEEVYGAHQESLVVLKKKTSSIFVGDFLLGRVLDGQGQPMDELGPLYSKESRIGEDRSLYAKPVHPLEREIIIAPMSLGVRAIDGLLTCGRGQRLGILAGSGVGKSVLLGMMARQAQADVNVIALIGERGREVREFIERDLGPEGLKKSVVIVSTSDQSPLLRMRGAYLATTIAEYFRDQGKNVLFLMDSVTRFCMAQREISLSLGEPPSAKGYTPSVFSMIPKLLERSGMGHQKGSITGIYSVLVEGDDMDDPIADATRSVLDGHIVLSRKIAQKNHFPAIDILQSTSRVMNSISSNSHLELSSKIKEWLSIFQQSEDLVNIGAYVRGSNKKIDQSILVIEKINSFLRQKFNENTTLEETFELMRSIVMYAENAYLEKN